MFLKKLEISGFKSFANKTTLDFSTSSSIDVRGITAIVGPNGSGKSNVADSIRWIMGEQSMKNLRGKKAEDIIFAGSGKKAKLGSAQATLFFDNTDKAIPLEFDEVAITRRIFRSGETEYSVNGSRVRLQDVVDILAKAGIGRESYSIINQGMADAVLNATPLERRTIIEEAAGVKQYQIKKERSLRKLDSTRKNLDRAKSLAEEIKPHLKMLKRQAEKAMQGEGVHKELKEKQTKLLTYLWNNFQQEKIRLNAGRDDMGRFLLNLQEEVDKLGEELSKESKQEFSKSTALSELERSRGEKRNRLNQIEREIIVTEGRIEIEKEKQKNIELIEEIKTQSIPVDLKYVRQGIEDIRRDQESLIDRLEHAESMDDLQDIKEFARSIQQRLHDLKTDIENGKKEEQKVVVEKPKVVEKNPPAGGDSQIVTELLAKIEELKKEKNALEQAMREIEIKISEEYKLDREKRQKFFDTERTLRAKQDELNKLKDKFNESKVALARVEVHEEDLRTEILQELKVEAETLQGNATEAPSGLDRAGLERDIVRLKGQMEQIGGIDPIVIQEYEETNTRFEFLTKESEDLEQAIISLKEIIKEMEQKVNTVFVTTFDQIEKEFTKYFRIIFGGGNASLKKVDVKRRSFKSKEEELEAIGEDGELVLDEDPDKKEKMETGIDIVASPPGKKISNLSMLSGGERSLTSLALLFAIIAHNPPPFAVLDEVEAALDEANSKRFSRIIQELSNNTQFIIITHNRETMRQASVMYGVTMGEDGISKLLSVRLDQIGQGGKIQLDKN